MGLWNQLTGKEDAQKANKQARIAHEQEYAKARADEYQATARASQLSNALLLSNLSDTMAGKGITDEIRTDYENRLAGQKFDNVAAQGMENYYTDLGNYYNSGGGSTAGRSRRRDASFKAAGFQSEIVDSTQAEIDRIGGILG